MQKIEDKVDSLVSVRLFERRSKIADRERRLAMQEELRAIANRLRKMFRTLSNELVSDRERSLALIAEYIGLFSDLGSKINRVRDGQLGSDDFLVNSLLVHEPTRRTWSLDRTEIKGNLQKVWPTASEIEDLFTRRDAKKVDNSVDVFAKAA